MGLIEIVLAGLCLNATCTSQNEGTYLLRKNQEDLLKLSRQLKSEHLRITTVSNGIFSGYKFDSKTGAVVGKGVAFDIINILQKKYGFNYTVIKPENDVFDELNDKNYDVKSMLASKKADLAAAFIPVTYDKDVFYSRNLDTTQWVVLMKRPKESATGSGLLAPFTAVVWTYIVVSVLAVGPMLYVIMYIRHKLRREDQYEVYSLQACMWFAYGALLKQGSTLSPAAGMEQVVPGPSTSTSSDVVRQDSSRILFSTWWIFITILTAFYTANLTAFLTLSRFTLPITKPEDITAKHYKWVTNKGNGIVRYLQANRNLSHAVGLPTMELALNNSIILNTYVTGRNMMYIREKIILEYLMYDNYKTRSKAGIEESKRCTFVITTFPIATLPRAFAFSPDFKYRKLFDLTIQDFVESGILEFKQRRDLPKVTICPLNLGNAERRLRNSDLLMTYLIVGCGLMLSTFIFFIEFLIHLWKYGSLKKSKDDRTSTWVGMINNNSDTKAPKFLTPPPPYSTLFKHAGIVDPATTKKVINGREYWIVNDKFGSTNLIPHRAPSALLFQFTH